MVFSIYSAVLLPPIFISYANKYLLFTYFVVSVLPLWHSERPKLLGVWAVLSAVGLSFLTRNIIPDYDFKQ